MKKIIQTIFISGVIFARSASAQIVPDNTLPINSSIMTGCVACEINGGTVRDGNLFHSFQEFSVPTGSQAIFNNPASIQNIFTRVTGSNSSNIDGLIRTNGSANLFLLNPNGIIFGQNAQLNIGGSFIASTADSIKFLDGTSLSAKMPENKPLLTISVPVGLVFGNNPRAITVRGNGQGLLPQTSQFDSVIRNSKATGLQVQSQKTLALIGGDITLDAAVLIANSGRLELGSLGGVGEVNLNVNTNDFTFGYKDADNFGNIQLERGALVDASGSNPGSIKIQGREISINDSSTVLIQNLGSQTAGDITINATESLSLKGTNPSTNIGAGIVNETVALGNSGNINITTRNLTVEEGGSILSKTFSTANGGALNINASNLFKVSGFAPHNPTVISTVSSATFLTDPQLSAGKAGDVNVFTKVVQLLNHGSLTTTNLGRGAGGNLTLNADTIDIVGGEATLAPSSIGANNIGLGNAGSLIINARNISLREGGVISTESLGNGLAGNIFVNARESIDISGGNSILVSAITSSVQSPTLELQQLFGLPAANTGKSGNITLNTPVLKVSERASVRVLNRSIGDAGTIKINANYILLDKQGIISASTLAGVGGDINLQSQDLQMRSGANITSSSRGRGDGGNITINSITLVAFDNSDITANAVDSFGGRVSINARGIFGTKFREQLTPESDITATSALGNSFSGVVNINTLAIDHSAGLIELPQIIADPSQQIAPRCSAKQGNNFVVTGRGGLLASPHDFLTAITPLVDLSNITDTSHKISISNTTASQSVENQLIEAQGWIVDASGQVKFVAQIANSTENHPGFAATNCNTL